MCLWWRQRRGHDPQIDNFLGEEAPHLQADHPGYWESAPIQKHLCQGLLHAAASASPGTLPRHINEVYLGRVSSVCLDDFKGRSMGTVAFRFGLSGGGGRGGKRGGLVYTSRPLFVSL